MAQSPVLSRLFCDILNGGDHFLSGLHRPSRSLPNLLSAVVEWGNALGRGLDEIAAVIEPCIRQSVLMSLIPAKAVDPTYDGSIDAAIEEHLATLGFALLDEERRVIRDICLNVRKLYGMDSRRARDATMSLAQLRGRATQYREIKERQGGRCVWCGVPLENDAVFETLEHMSPKHIGDDVPDGRNWALACKSCNEGKADCLAWPTRPAAHDYLGRADFERVRSLGLAQRWSVLMRTPRCDFCDRGASSTELAVYRRIRTGLPIPSNCSTACTDCCTTQSLDVLGTHWAKEEAGRVA